MARNSLLADWAGYITSGTIGSSATFPAGHVIQVVTSNKNTTQRLTPTSALNWQDVSDLSVDITPATGSKVLVLVYALVGGKANYQNNARLVRDTTAIGVGSASGGNPAATFFWRAPGDSYVLNLAGSYLDASPGGDGSTAITYKFQVSGEGTYYMYINRAYAETNDYYGGRFNSSITVMEIT